VHLELTEGKNPGKEKALAAAKAVDGKAIFPIFAPDEQSYPDNLEPVTPLTARCGSLTEEQQAAITKMKRYTDFNDLVTNSVLGREGLEHQVMTKVNNIIESQKERSVVRHEQELFVKCEHHQHRQTIKM
jgi:putative DNA primase/helicase